MENLPLGVVTPININVVRSEPLIRLRRASPAAADKVYTASSRAEWGAELVKALADMSDNDALDVMGVYADVPADTLVHSRNNCRLRFELGQIKATTIGDIIFNCNGDFNLIAGLKVDGAGSTLSVPDPAAIDAINISLAGNFNVMTKCESRDSQHATTSTCFRDRGNYNTIELSEAIDSARNLYRCTSGTGTYRGNNGFFLLANPNVPNITNRRFFNADNITGGESLIIDGGTYYSGLVENITFSISPGDELDPDDSKHLKNLTVNGITVSLPNAAMGASNGLMKISECQQVMLSGVKLLHEVSSTSHWSLIAQGQWPREGYYLLQNCTMDSGINCNTELGGIHAQNCQFAQMTNGSRENVGAVVNNVQKIRDTLRLEQCRGDNIGTRVYSMVADTNFTTNRIREKDCHWVATIAGGNCHVCHLLHGPESYKRVGGSRTATAGSIWDAASASDRLAMRHMEDSPFIDYDDSLAGTGTNSDGLGTPTDWTTGAMANAELGQQTIQKLSAKTGSNPQVGQTWNGALWDDTTMSGT